MTARSSIASRALVCLVTVLVLGAGLVGLVTAATPISATSTLETDTDPLENATTETAGLLEEAVHETTGTLENETDNTTDDVDGTTDELENTTNETIEELESGTETTTNTIDETENETTEAVEETTDETDSTPNTTTGSGWLLEEFTLESWYAVGTTLGPIDTELDGSTGISTESTDSEGNDGASTNDGTADESADDDTDDGFASSGGASTAADAVLVGLLGAITASGTAAGGGAGASGATGGASGLTGSWLSQSTGLRHLRRAGSILPWEIVPLFRYSRYDDSDPLENDLRRAVYETIEADPGCYLSQVSERSDVALSTVRHHVRVLEEEGLVTAAKVNGKRRYYLETDGEGSAEATGDGDAVPDVELHGALEEPAKRDVLDTLAELGTAQNGRLADELGRDPSTVSHHLSALEDAGLVVREKDGRAVVNELAPGVETALSGTDDSLEDGVVESSASTPADD